MELIKRRILWAGDSTVQYNSIETYPQTGIGQAFPLYLRSDVALLNFAKNGRSTKSFIDEGRLAEIDAELRVGDYLFIQFGHNDEKQDPSRGTVPFGSFQKNLQLFVETAQKHEAFPVLITPLARRHFSSDGVFDPSTHGEYPEAMRQLASNLSVPLIDLTEKSCKFLAAVGDEKSKRYYMNFPAGVYDSFPDGKNDNTHLRYEGAVLFAGMIAEQMPKIISHF